MRRIFLIFAGISLAILVIFGIASGWDHPLFRDPAPWLGEGGVGTVLASTGLLVMDVLLPIPSSLIMIANGSVFGLFPGSLVSLLGGLLATGTGWLIGRAGSRQLVSFTGSEGMASAAAFVHRWGDLAIMLSRPVPVLAEAVAILCGGLRISPWRMGLFSILGLYPPCLLYAFAGSRASAAPDGWIALLWVLGMAFLVWVAGKRLGRMGKPDSEPSLPIKGMPASQLGDSEAGS